MLVLGVAGWWALDWSWSGYVAIGGAGLLWLEFWVTAIVHRRALRRGQPINIPIEGFISRRLSDSLAKLGRRMPDQWASTADTQVREHPFRSALAFTCALNMVLLSLGLIGVLAIGVPAAPVIAITVFTIPTSAVLIGTVIWLVERKPKTAQAITEALANRSAGDLPPV
jgi:hypothetical protein